MKTENNFEVKNVDLEEMNEIVEIKDEELKVVVGGGVTMMSGSLPNEPAWCRLF